MQLSLLALFCLALFVLTTLVQAIPSLSRPRAVGLVSVEEKYEYISASPVLARQVTPQPGPSAPVCMDPQFSCPQIEGRNIDSESRHNLQGVFECNYKTGGSKFQCSYKDETLQSTSTICPSKSKKTCSTTSPHHKRAANDVYARNQWSKKKLQANGPKRKNSDFPKR